VPTASTLICSRPTRC